MDKSKLKKYKKQAGSNDYNVQKGLMNIYSNKDGSLPDISHLDVSRKNRWSIYLMTTLILAILLAGIFWLGSLLLNPNSTSSKKSIELVFDGQQNIASGDEVIYVLSYKNLEKVPLHDVELILRYPDGFKFISATPESDNEFNTTWTLGQIQSNQSGKIEVKGKLIGEVGSISTINATASYRPDNFSSTFKETVSFNSQITTSILEIDIEGEQNILPEKKISYKIKYKNNSEQDLENIRVIVEYPKNFIFQESTPKSTQNEEDARNLNNQWLIDNLSKKQEGEIEIIGGYIIDENQNLANFKVQIGFFDEETNEFSLQQEKTISTEIIQTNLSLDLIVNGSTQGQPINFDELLTYSIVYENKGEKNLDEVSFNITLDSDVLDWESLEDKHGGQISNNTISWGKDEISELDLVRPGDKGSIDFSIRTKEATKVNLDNDNLVVKSKASATMEKIEELEVIDLVIESNEVENSINTDLQIQVVGRYFDDDNIAVGTGPLPPVVGEKTSFRIFWSLANSLHEINDITVTTKLPSGIDWDNKFLVSVGKIAYSSSDRTITWTINRLPPNISFEDANVWFDVSTIPTKQQARKLLILTEQVLFTGTDSVTGSEVIKTGKAITSNLSDDPIGGGRGLVIDITE